MMSIILLALLMLSGSACANGDVAAEAYGKITDGLIGLRKQFPAAQSKVYALLDQVEKLYKVAKTSSSECVELKKKLSDGQQETRSQLALAKKNLEQAKADLSKRFDEQQQRLLALEKQRDHLMAKASVKNELQVGDDLKKA